MSPALDISSMPAVVARNPKQEARNLTPVYYNARLDPINYLEGPLSTNPATRLRQMLARPGIITAPGICDGISARCAIEAGFECLYQSGAATTASRLGQPDLAIATLNDFTEAAEMVCSLEPTMPVIADADTGFGGPAMIARTVTKYAKAGVAGLHIEDQVQTKRCGHLLGKQVVSREEFITHVCFIEGVKTKQLLERTVAALAPKPVLVNVISGGLTPSFTSQEAEASGAKIIIFSLASCVPMVHALRAAMKSLKETGTDFVAAQGMGPREFFEVMGLWDVVNMDSKAGGTAFNSI
ncbi:oxaloacetate acetylhydrolase [Mycena metata]|uniref:Oxaloacetate acetylhydrolase n=1 Tax=Mycena metata TaxID=1033252 RepID=A0AAD7HBH4_9AGAR|nr:oxaloacetate acetylhydrolase [Mycena metata]